jgi:aspartyl-tRNA(Asn)/glutamyl-tRNA(Gln) amidotransferase subunit B
MRSKEESHDYRYFPDPDLLPVHLSEEFIEEIRSGLPELPDEKRQRFINDLGLSSYDADVLIAERGIAEYFEEAAKGRDAKAVSSWITGDLFGQLNKEGVEIKNCPISAFQLGSLVELISDGTISARTGREVFFEMWSSGKDPRVVVEEKGLKQVSDTGALEIIIDQVIAEGTNQVGQYKSGNEKILGWFVGQVMKKTDGQANPKIVNELLRQKLK